MTELRDVVLVPHRLARQIRVALDHYSGIAALTPVPRNLADELVRCDGYPLEAAANGDQNTLASPVDPGAREAPVAHGGLE